MRTSVLLLGLLVAACSSTEDPVSIGPDAGVAGGAGAPTLDPEDEATLKENVAEPLLGRCGALAGMEVAADDQIYGVALVTGRLYHVDGNSGEIRIAAKGLRTPHGVALADGTAGSAPTVAYVTELLAGRVVRVNLTTRQHRTVCDGFKLPARLALFKKAGKVAGAYVTELASGKLYKATFGLTAAQCERELIAEGLGRADGVTILPKGDSALVASFQPSKLGGVHHVDLSSGQIKATLGDGELTYPAKAVLAPDYIKTGVFAVPEVLGNEVSWFEGDSLTRSFGGILGPSGVGWDSSESSLIVAEALRQRIVLVDLNSGDLEPLATFTCQQDP